MTRPLPTAPWTTPSASCRCPAAPTTSARAQPVRRGAPRRGPPVRALRRGGVRGVGPAADQRAAAVDAGAPGHGQGRGRLLEPLYARVDGRQSPRLLVQCLHADRLRRPTTSSSYFRRPRGAWPHTPLSFRCLRVRDPTVSFGPFNNFPYLTCKA